MRCIGSFPVNGLPYLNSEENRMVGVRRTCLLQNRVVRLQRKRETRNEALWRPVLFPENAEIGERMARANIYHLHIHVHTPRPHGELHGGSS
jgi:hypothetical protein